MAKTWDGPGWADPSRISRSLGLFAGGPSNEDRDGAGHYFHQEGPRSRSRKGWRVARSPSGLPVLLAGSIDNHDEIAAELGCPAASAAQLYGAAFDRWGDLAEDRLIGCFCTIIALPDETVRLTRSAWGGRPLYYARDRSALVVATVPRIAFAAGWPQELRAEAIARMLVYRIDHDDASPFEGLAQVPIGSIVHVTRDGARINRWYDPVAAARPVKFASDEDYVAAANEVLAKAARAALRLSRKPGVTLSGGLDSAMVADELSRQLPGDATLRSYTFHPVDEWRGNVPPRFFPDDRPYVREYLNEHPRITGRFIDNRDTGFDHYSRQLVLSSSSTCGPGSAITAPIYGCFAAAAEDGCDWMFTATDGNTSISNEAPWAWPEMLRTGKWGELWRAARDRPADPRPVWRRIAAMALMPHLPFRLRWTVRAVVHGRNPDEQMINPLVRADGPAAALAVFPPGEGTCSITGDTATRGQWLRELHRSSGLDGLHDVSLEEVFGIRCRDVTRYRPLIEFFGGVPTDQFLRGGVNRYLGRRMAVGRMPEAQRSNVRFGMHNTDWHMRMTPRLPELRARVEAMAAHPLIGPMINADMARALLDDWPAESPDDVGFGCAWRFDLPGALLVTDYVNAMTGRNQ